MEDLRRMATSIPKSDNLREYGSKGTIQKYHGEDPRNEQEIFRQELLPALQHGEATLEKAREVFGEEYVERLLEFTDTERLGADEKALILITLENEMMRRTKADPTNTGLQKLQDLVRARSQAHLRTGALAINYGKLRRIAEVGYDLSLVTDKFFSAKEIEQKEEISRAVQASAEQINQAAEEIEQADGSEDEALQERIDSAVDAEITKLYERLPQERRRAADKALAALEKFQAKIRAKSYADPTGMVAIIDGGITAIRKAIKAGVAIADAVEYGIEKIKEKLGGQWEKEGEFRRDMLEGFAQAGVKAEGPTPMAKRLEQAKERLRERIEEVKTELSERKRAAEKANVPLQKDEEYIALEKEYADLVRQRDEILPDPRAEQKLIDKSVTRLQNEIVALDAQIQQGAKGAKAQSKTPSSPQLNRLRSLRDQKVAALEALDPDPKRFTRQALIEAGFGRDITVTVGKAGNKRKERRKAIDWKKLAGAEGSVEKIRTHVEKALKDKDFSSEQIARMQAAFEKEYTDLRAHVVQSAINDLNKRNKRPEATFQKSAARKLAELYNYGLFNQDPVQYEILLGRAIGVNNLSADRFRKMEALGRAMETLFASTFKGKRLNETELSAIIQALEDKIRIVLHEEIQQHGSWGLKAMDWLRTWMDATQRMALNNLKQAVENPLSGLQQRFVARLDELFSRDAATTKAIRQQHRQLAAAVYRNMVLEGGATYGEVSTMFVNKGNLETYINKMSDSEIVHAVTSTLIGRTTLDAADSMFKAKLTEQKFIHHLLRILTRDRLVDGKLEKGMPKEEALQYVAQAITGQSFEDAKQEARKIIATVNQNGKIVGDSEAFVIRLANDIVRAALVNGRKITEEQVTAAYNSAYKATGRSLGHVANNPVSEGVQTVSGKLEKGIDDAIKNKDYNSAAVLTLKSIFFRNIMNPFVAGGTNWVVLKLEKNGLGLGTGLWQYLRQSRIDMTSEAGMRNLEKALYEEAKARDSFMRGAIGGASAVLLAMLWFGVSDEEEYRKWRAKNLWAARYLDIITPEAVLATFAAKDKKLGRYAENLLNKNEQYDKARPFIKGSVKLFQDGKGDEAWGQFGEGLGNNFGVPVPWRLVRDGQNIWLGASGGEPYRIDGKSNTFLSGALKAGLVDYAGGRPEGEEEEEGGGSGKKPQKKAGKPSVKKSYK